VMSVFLAWLSFFSTLTANRAHRPAWPPTRDSDIFRLGIVENAYWIVAVAIVLFTFKGEPIVNVSGSDNYDIYIANLKAQSGSLEYFLIVIALGSMLIHRPFARLCYAGCITYYLYFCFTRGYRVQMLEMIILAACLHLSKHMSLRNVFLASVAGFMLLQAHGFMKHGAADAQTLFTIMAGDQIRSNQTEVFYTSNNVVNPVLDGLIPWAERIGSLTLALIASCLPGSAVPTTWHSTLSAQSVTSLPGGGGGFIAGHYYYWGGQLGLFLGAALVAAIFKSHIATRSQRTYLLTCLLIATSPRWVAYEPVANLMRLGLYFLIGYEILRFFSVRSTSAAGESPALALPTNGPSAAS